MIQMVGEFWYLLAGNVHAGRSDKCNKNFLYCGKQQMDGSSIWDGIRDSYHVPTAGRGVSIIARVKKHMCRVLDHKEKQSLLMNNFISNVG
ncbi:Uncharacterized protein TCM_037049 [Theobroma cacao]|uniref:Uncharacterized protein n=1 Tax=Theobroma cacao TaxID=3641 RepID=A0A061GK56_THECC|nr:Uncharacterized protein TCM_037049 [Theobroma cacao]